MIYNLQNEIKLKDSQISAFERSKANKTKSPYKKACIYKAAPTAVVKQAIELTIGHGLGSTK